jgi:tetratricopeptide (TPR) repeat protein
VPLAVTLIAHVGRSSQLSPSELLESWNKEQTKLLDLGSPDRLRSINHSIQLSLQSSAMRSTPDALQLLSIVAVLPGGAVLRTLPSLAPNIKSPDHAIRTLLSVSLGYKNTSGTLRILSLIRSYISQHHAPDSTSLESLRNFYYDLADRCECSPGDKEFLRVRDEVAAEESNIESVLLYCLSQSGDEPAVRAIVQYSQYLYWHHPHSEVLEAAVNVARQGRLTELLPRCFQRLGNIFDARSEYTRAITAFEEAQALFHLTGNRLQAARCLRRLGEILRIQSHYDKARTRLAEARDEYQAVGNQLGTVRCLRSIFRMQERYDEARTALEGARERFQELNKPLNAAQCLQSIGLICYNTKQYDDAHKIFKDTQRQFQALGEPLGATKCLQCLGNVLLEQGQYGEARATLEKAQERYQEIGERLAAVECLRSLGDILRRETRYNEALSSLEEAQSQFEAIGSRLGVAQCAMQIGHCLSHLVVIPKLVKHSKMRRKYIRR